VLRRDQCPRERRRSSLWARTLPDVHFVVRARDADHVGSRLLDLAEEHWNYLDRFADQVVLRGPLLSVDGSEHRGSIHVLDFLDRSAAERFAFNEPYWLTGLYRDVAIRPVETLVIRQAFDGTSAYEQRPGSFLAGEWPASPRAFGSEQLTEVLDCNQTLTYCGLLVDESARLAEGLVAALDEAPAEASTAFQAVADLMAGRGVELFAERWRRGGRVGHT
jgi:uncharacterized protein